MFPVVTYLYSVEFKRLGKDVASIYALDTLGAAIGAALAGFFLVPVVGLKVTIIAASLLFILMGVVVAMMEKPGKVAESAELAKGGAIRGLAGLDPTHVLVLCALFVSGFAALVLEVPWSRYFHLLYGTSIYAFALVVAAFLSGLSAGSFLIKKRLDRIKNPILVFAYIEVLIAGFSLVILQTSEGFEAMYIYLFHATNNFYLFQGILFVTAFLVMLVPTSLMGANFPLAVRIFTRASETRAEDSGLVFSINTAGGIFGAFAAGFFIIPAMGLEMSSILATVSYLLIGFVFLMVSGRRVAHGAAVAALTAAIFVFGWLSYGEPNLNVSVYYNGVRKQTYSDYARIKKMTNIVYSRQGLYGLVAVEQDNVLKRMSLWTNGKVDASTAKNDMQNQEFLAHLPLLLHQDPKKVLNIGFGSGVTAGAVTTHLDVEVIDCVELDPLVVEAAGKFFMPFNNAVLKDPRVRVHYEDGRHFLDTSRESYDIIISEPSNIWISGVSQLFTREFYGIADEHLNEGGIFAQWLPAYDLTKEDVRLIMKTLKERFEHVIYWTNRVDIIILASHEPLSPDRDYIREHMDDPLVVTDLKKAMTDVDMASVSTLLIGMASTETVIPKIIKDFDRVNTDNLNYLEFNTVQNSYNIAHRVRRH
jgi:spermidine synthase